MDNKPSTKKARSRAASRASKTNTVSIKGGKSKMNPGMFSSKTDDWATPQALFDELDAVYHFTLDVCASHANAKCAKYFTREEDGLAQDWSGEVCWMNPPYGKFVKKWVEKASNADAIVVGLLPSRTGPRWFQNHVFGQAEITFLPGRLKFGAGTKAAPFDSVVAVWGKCNRTALCQNVVPPQIAA